jgi:hypothetical protein
MHFCIARQVGGMDPFLLLPSTKDKWRGAAATVISDQRGESAAEVNVLGWGGIKGIWVHQGRHGDECMHNTFLEFLG